MVTGIELLAVFEGIKDKAAFEWFDVNTKTPEDVERYADAIAISLLPSESSFLRDLLLKYNKYEKEGVILSQKQYFDEFEQAIADFTPDEDEEE